jgi:hypothetical protein
MLSTPGSGQEKKRIKPALTVVNRKFVSKDACKPPSVLENNVQDIQKKKNYDDNVVYILSPAELEAVALDILAASAD